MEMIVRVQGKEGTKRITTLPTETLQRFLEKVIQELHLNPNDNFSLFRSQRHRDELTHSHLHQQLQQIPVKHGDMLYLSEKSGDSGGGGGGWGSVAVEEDEVDRELGRRDGKIQRKRDPQLCRHAPEAKCINCVPLEPWDERYLKSIDPPIKHLSFHCYVRKLTSGVDRGKFASLEDLSCKIKPGCQGHPPWPAGICTKCQPSAITLARQPYRHVDNVMFEDSKIVNRFIEGWRASGRQRIGYLYGRYIPLEESEVPLGIRAEVAAIYEPPQVSTKLSVELLEDPHEKEVQELATMLGLRKVGWIFTDLEPEENGRVAFKRSIHTHLLSAEECIMAADFQNQHPSACRLSATGCFGSKFVTICVSGNEANEVNLKGYQVSNQCMALVRDGCLVPTLDAPALGYIRESTPEQYVPDVFYKTKGEYGSDITKLARPLPLEYLIIELTVTTPKVPRPLLVGGRDPPFPVENRTAVGGHVQDFDTLATYIQNQHGSPFLAVMSDFHLLLYLYTNDIAGIALKPYLSELCAAIRQQDRNIADQWKRQESWATLEQLVYASVPSPTTSHPPLSHFSHSAAAPPPLTGGSSWSCKHCTLLNPPHLTECDACHLPRTH